jgi:hypothetical protein
MGLSCLIKKDLLSSRTLSPPNIIGLTCFIELGYHKIGVLTIRAPIVGVMGRYQSLLQPSMILFQDNPWQELHPNMTDSLIT